MKQAKDRSIRPPRDRYAELLVWVVVLVALLLGWGVKAGAEARAVHIQFDGLRVSYGHNWIREPVTPPDLLKISNPGADARFKTTITVSAWPAESPESAAKALNQRRLQIHQLYQFLGGETISWRGQEAYRNQFAYVYVSPDLLRPRVPVVLHGMDHLFVYGDRLYVITVLSDESVYNEALVEWERLLNSLAFK